MQPYNLADHLVRYAVPTNATSSAHAFSWETNRVTFQAQHGTFAWQPAASNVISSWTNTNTVPSASDENVRINLWLSQGTAPTEANEVEVIIRNFRFVPFGDPRAARFTNIIRAPGGQVHAVLSGEFDRFYEIQGSTNLTEWQTLAEILATNATFTFTESSSAAPPPKSSIAP